MFKLRDYLRMYAAVKGKSLSELARYRDKMGKEVAKLHISLQNEAKLHNPRAKDHVLQAYVQNHPRYKELKRLRRAHLKAANEYAMGAIMSIKR
jgi:hypothetical protein